MNQKEAYRKFFLKSEEGKAYIAEARRIIDDLHEKSESDADKARDYSQQAKGARLLIDHIVSVTTDIKKGKAPQ